MGFNNMFSAYWNKQFVQEAEVVRIVKTIESMANSFCFKLNVKTGFVNQTTNGTQPVNANPENYTQFVKAFNGREGIIAQMENVVHLSALKIGEKIDKTSINKKGWGATSVNESIRSLADYINDETNTQYEFPTGSYDWVEKVMTVGSSYYKDVENDKNYILNSDVKIVDQSSNWAYAFVYEGAVKNSDGSYNQDDIRDPQVIFQNIYKGETDDYIQIVDLTKINNSLDPYYTKWFSKPEENNGWFKVYVDTMNQNASIGSMPGGGYMGDSTQWEFVRRFNCLTTHEINEDDLFKLFLIPQHSKSDDTDENTFFYINNCTSYYYANGRTAYNEITFASVNDSLTTTGQVIRQTIQMAAPGEGYALPKLIYNDNGKAIDWEVNTKYCGDTGVRTVQVECLGPAAISNLVVYGRPIEKIGDINKVYPSRPLLLEDLKFPISDTLTEQSNPETQFYSGFMYPEIKTFYKDWKEKRQAQYTESIVKTFDGWLEAGDKSSYSVIASSNTNGLSLRDSTWTLTGSNASETPIDMRANGYISLIDKNSTILTAPFNANEFTYSNHPLNRPVDYLNHGSICNTIYKTMPIVQRQEIPWSISDIPLIGGWLNKLTLGIPIGWRQVSDLEGLTYPKWNGINFFISKNLFDWYTESFWDVSDDSTGSTRVPFEAFKSGSDDEVNGLLNTNSMTTAIIGNLSDKATLAKYYSTNNGVSYALQGYVNCSTAFLGTDMNVDGKHYQWRWGEQSTVQNAESTNVVDYDTLGSGKYIIDAIGYTGVFKGAVRLSLFYTDPDKSYDPFSTFIWQTTLKSKSLYTDNIRDIQTIYKTSYLDDFIEDDINFIWPPSKPEPNPSIDIRDIQIDSLSLNDSVVDYNILDYGNCTVDNGKEGVIRRGQSYPLETNKTFEIVDFKKYGITTTGELDEAYKSVGINLGNIKFGTYTGQAQGTNDMILNAYLTGDSSIKTTVQLKKFSNMLITDIRNNEYSQEWNNDSGDAHGKIRLYFDDLILKIDVTGYSIGTSKVQSMGYAPATSRKDISLPYQQMELITSGTVYKK